MSHVDPPMTKVPSPREALAELEAQHAALRARIALCEALADELDRGAADPAQLVHEVAALRVAFDTHNQFEERLLCPVLINADWMGAVRVARMVEDHVEEHRAIRRGFEPEATSCASGSLRGVLASLRDHLDSEERYFLSRRVLRDDRAR